MSHLIHIYGLYSDYIQIWKEMWDMVHTTYTCYTLAFHVKSVECTSRPPGYAPFSWKSRVKWPPSGPLTFRNPRRRGLLRDGKLMVLQGFLIALPSIRRGPLRLQIIPCRWVAALRKAEGGLRWRLISVLYLAPQRGRGPNKDLPLHRCFQILYNSYQYELI